MQSMKIKLIMCCFVFLDSAMKRIRDTVMLFWCFIIISVVNMKSSIALKQNEIDNVLEDDLVADEVKEKDDEPEKQEMSIS